MADNNTSLAKVTTAIGDAVQALRVLADQVKNAPADISAPLSNLADNLTAAVTAAGQPVTAASTE